MKEQIMHKFPAILGRRKFLATGLAALGSSRLGKLFRPVLPVRQALAKGMAPCFKYCIEQFGTERCMFESNWPVDEESFSYTVLWNAFKRMTKDFSDTEPNDLFYNTATNVYRL